MHHHHPVGGRVQHRTEDRLYARFWKRIRTCISQDWLFMHLTWEAWFLMNTRRPSLIPQGFSLLSMRLTDLQGFSMIRNLFRLSSIVSICSHNLFSACFSMHFIEIERILIDLQSCFFATAFQFISMVANDAQWFPMGLKWFSLPGASWRVLAWIVCP